MNDKNLRYTYITTSAQEIMKNGKGYRDDTPACSTDGTTRGSAAC